MNTEKSRADFITMIFRENQYYNIVRDTLLYVLPNLSDADLDDCISEVYKVALKTPNIETHPQIHGWLNLTAKNIAKKFRRIQSIERQLAELSDDIPDPTRLEIRFEELEQDKELLASIKKSLRLSEYVLFELRYLENKSCAEIAEITGIKQHSVDMRVNRVKTKLKKFLKKP